MSQVLQIAPKTKYSRSDVKLIAGGRVCLKCEQGKSWGEFAKDVHGYNQKTATCKPCRNEKGRSVYKENPVVRRSGIKNRPDKLKRLYGITYEDVVRVFDKQFGKCANIGCGKDISLSAPNGKNRAVIDHCHTTGKFRALLCTKCNLDLGMLENNENRFLGLVEYLQKHKNNIRS